jgi:hypothetical protein
MIAAIFGLVGVVVGGLLNGAVTAWQARRSTLAHMRAGARLVGAELYQANLIFSLIERMGGLPPQFSGLKLSADAWDKYREVLARTLGETEWGDLVTAYSLVTFGLGRENDHQLLDDMRDRSPDRSYSAVVSRASLIMNLIGRSPLSFSKRVKFRTLRLIHLGSKRKPPRPPAEM